jgi:hypothetical protein
MLQLHFVHFIKLRPSEGGFIVVIALIIRVAWSRNVQLKFLDKNLSYGECGNNGDNVLEAVFLMGKGEPEET